MRYLSHFFQQTFASCAILSLFFLVPQITKAQLLVSGVMTPTQLVQNVLVGTGITVSNVTYTGALPALGSFSNGQTTNLGFVDGVIMASGNIVDIPQPGTAFASTQLGTPGDADLENLIVGGNSSYDATVLQFDFIPLSDTIRFRYTFGSEEYPEYVNSSYNDVFGFFISGPNPLGGNYVSKNMALIPGTSTPVSINNVNNGTGNTGPCVNCAFYWDNSSGGTIVYDGMTTILTAWCVVVPCVQYHIKLAISDVGDESFDSGVFLEANSFSSNAVTINTYYTSLQTGTNAVEGCSDALISFVLPATLSYDYTVTYSIQGTATNGVDYPLIANNITIPAGQDSAVLTISPILDGLTEGTETVSLVVQTNICGGYDTVWVNILDNILLNVNTSNDTTICNGSATICAFPNGGLVPYTFNWSGGAGNTSCVTVSPSATTTYIVTLTDLCGSTATENVTIIIGSGTADAGNDQTICEGETATLVATGGSGYTWSNGVNTAVNGVSPVVTTTYWVTVAGTCDAVDSVTVIVNPNPTFTASASPASINMGETTTLTAGGGTVYNWTSIPPDPSLAGQQNSPNPVVSPQSTTIYNVTGTDANGCTGSATVTVIVTPIYPNVDFVGFPVEGCEPLLVSFEDFSNNVLPGATYYWDFGNGTHSTLRNPSAYYEENGYYSVTLTITNPGDFAGTMMAQDYIHVFPSPVAIFGVLPESEAQILDPTIYFFDNSYGPATSWLWSFGDGFFDQSQNVYHTYPDDDTGSYTVILLVTNEYGCEDSATKEVYIRPEWSLYLPSGFTPDNDGKNEYYYVKGFGILEDGFSLAVYSRWGQQLFFSGDIDEGWDGLFNGQEAPNGVYMARVIYKDARGREHTKEQTFSLIR